jgi:hypothetical protein
LPKHAFIIEFYQEIQHERFEVLTMMSMKVAVFWNLEPYSMVDTDRRFRRAYCLHHQSDTQDQPSTGLETKPLTWHLVYDNVVLGQGYHTPHGMVIDEYGTMME